VGGENLEHEVHDPELNAPMGFSLRKTFSFGPLRLNLSSGGIGASIGVRGLRIGVNRHGIYLHVGRGGVYYRTYLTGRRETAAHDDP
jgi:hypothetical protein